MNKVQFNELICYLKNRPAEAQRLMEVIGGKSECKQAQVADQWLTAKEVGLRIGQSGKWVREHRYELPADCVVQRGLKRTWYFNFTRIENQLQMMRG